MTGRVQARLVKLGIALPKAPVPAANYVPWVISGSQLFIAGQLPMVDGKVGFVGRVGEDLPLEEGVEAARICAVNILAQTAAATGGDLDRVVRCVRLEGFVNAAPGFEQHPAVVNGASDVMAAVFGDAGRHARFAVGASSLPFNAAVEVAAILELA